MGTQRMIEFQTTSDERAAQVEDALVSAFRALDEQRPAGVRLAYWRVPGGRRFLALIELADEARNPLLGLAETRALPGLIGESVAGGYPRPETVQQVGSYGFDL